MDTIKKLKNKLPAKGSVLVFTLIILFIILASAIGISSVSVLERKGAGSSDVSVQSFQIANSGAEIILKELSKASGSDSLTSIGCSEGRVTGLISSGKNYEITFYRNDETQITECDTDVSEVDKIKSIGSYANTTRAIEVAVAAGASGVTGGCTMKFGVIQATTKWGQGCLPEGTVVANGPNQCLLGADGSHYCGTSGVDAGSNFYCICIEK